MTNERTHTRALIVSTAVLTLGISASIAGNLQAINLADRAPGIGAYLSAIFWPVTLFGVIEVLLHTPWLRNWRDDSTKVIAVGLAGAMAAYISYFHLAHTLSAYGYDVASRYMGPLAIDAAMAMATLSLNRVGQARRAALLDTVAKPAPAIVQAAPTTADEAVDIWSRLGQDTDTETPALPVPVSPAPRSNEVRPEAVPADAADLIHAWLDTPVDVRPREGQVDMVVAGSLGKSTRTARRWREAISDARRAAAGLPVAE
jgi:hypothetical protein